MGKHRFLATYIAFGLGVVSCDADPTAPGDRPEAPAASSTELVWAMNVGGTAYIGIDGTAYEAETSVRGGTVGRLETIKGSQDAPLYCDYREGDIEVTHPINDGSYDVTFYFAEPEDIGGGERVFDVFAENRRVIDDLDVMIELNIAGGYQARAFFRNRQGRFVLGVHDDADAFQVQQDIDNVFLHTVDGGVFVRYALDAAIDDRAAAYRRQQYPAQRVTERMTKTAFQRLDRNLGVISRLLFDFDVLRLQ